MAQDPIQIIIAYVKLARPVHWVKNVAVFAALIFSGLFFEKGLFFTVFEALIAFNLATSASYVLNDILDRDRDREHPTKKYRPIASGKIPPSNAIIYSAALAIASLVLALSIADFFALLIVLYLSIQFAYSIYLKHLAVVDIILIASGFVIRVYAGAYIIDAHLSVWFLLCVIATSLFLASGKRRSEFGATGGSDKTRKSLSKYTKDTLNAYVSMFANSAWLSWSLFTFFESPRAAQPLWLFLSEISKATTINKLLMITIPVVIFGIMRYEALIFQDKTEAPEKVLLTDPGLILSAVVWVGIVFFVFYGGVAV